MTTITLQRIVLPFEQRYEGCPGMFYRTGPLAVPRPSVVPNIGWLATVYPSTPLPETALAGRGVALDRDVLALRIDAGRTASLCTYFNLLSVGKWTRFTSARNFSVTLDLEGAGQLVFYEFSSPDMLRTPRYLYCAQPREAGRFDFDCASRQQVELRIPATDATCVGIDIVASGDVALYGGCYQAQVAPDRLNPVDICLLTTTFQKEEYVTANLDMLRTQVWGSQDEVGQHLDMIVVDNGRTLEAADVEGSHVRLFPNDNVGGAGGFARGMIEALRSDKRYTHVLVMDDDVSMHPEAFRRTYALLRLIRPQYADSYVSGAMLRLNEMNIQHEDVGFVHPHGYFMPRKGVRDMYDVRNLVINEAVWAPLPNQYAAWWYCCIPMRYVTEESLPLPLFVRGDDVEFSLRNKPNIISLAGICVWHMGFNKKFTASMEYYQVIRNSLIVQACTPSMARAAFMRQATELVLYNLYQYAYDYADLILDAVEDFMRGPSFLEQAKGIEIIKAKGAYNEKMLPLAQFRGIDVDFDLSDDQHLQAVRVDYQVDKVRRAVRMATINGHMRAPRFFYREGVGSTPYDWEFTTGNQTGYEQILAVNPDEHTGSLRSRNVQRYRQVMRRMRALQRRWRLNKRSINRQWQQAYPYLTSLGFWRNYLGID